MSNVKSKTIRMALLLAAATFAATTAQAHKAWMLPSQTVLADKGWITVDGAVSNDLFYFNHNPLALDNLRVIAPDGSEVKPQNTARGKYRSTFDLELTQSGTYRLAVFNNNLNATWKEGETLKRQRGTAEAIAAAIPANATDRKVTQNQSRLETFVTVGKPDRKAIALTGKGLELEALTHPNDLYAGEAAKLRFLLDGKPAAGVVVAIIPGGSRYRDGQDEISLQTDAKGLIEVKWPAAGMYWLEASVEGVSASIPQATTRNASYTATFEVLNQ